MAPEMLALEGKGRKKAPGYTYMADYWSLGVLLFFMLTGGYPFAQEEADNDFSDKEIATIMEGHVEFPGSISDDCINFIYRLLEVNDTKRLGFGVNGLENVKNHPFYLHCESFHWEDVLKKLCHPPIVPSDIIDFTTGCAPKYAGFKDLPFHTEAEAEVETPSDEDQIYFATWYVNILCL
jgi:serine/threonine protein kinase